MVCRKKYCNITKENIYVTIHFLQLKNITYLCTLLVNKLSTKKIIMEKKFKTKGIEFVPKNEVSNETRSKLNKLMTEKVERLNKLVSDYKAGSLKMQ